MDAGTSRDAGPVGGLTFPIKLRCASIGALRAEAGLEAALARALGRAFARARAALPRPLAVGAGVVLRRPSLAEGSPLGGTDATAVLARVWRAIEAAAAAQAVPRVAPSGATAARPPVRRREAPAEPPAERFDPARFDAAASTYEIKSYQGGKSHPPVATRGDPLAKLRELYGYVIDALDALGADQAKVADLSQGRLLARFRLSFERLEMENERGRLAYLSDKPKLAKQRELSMSQALTLLNTLRPRIAALDRRAAGLAMRRSFDHRIAVAFGVTEQVTDQDVLKDTLVELGDVYLALATPTRPVRAQMAFDPAQKFQAAELLSLHEKWFGLYDAQLKDAFAELAFLDEYYAQERVLVGVAMMRFAAMRIGMLWTQLGKVRPPVHGPPPDWPSLEAEHRDPQFYLGSLRVHRGSMDYLSLQIAIAFRDAERVYSVVRQQTALPRRTRDVGPNQSREMTAWVSAKVWHLQVEIAVLGLWQNLPIVQTILEQYPNVDRGPNGGKWLAETLALVAEFQGELRPERFPHEGIQQKVEGWQVRVEKLFKEIKDAIEREQLERMIGWMIVGLVLSFGVSLWLQTVLQGSKLLLFVAEGVSMTAINVAIGAAQGQPVTLKGVAGELVLNFALLGFGRFISMFRGGGEAAEQIARSRRLLTGLAQGATMVTATTLGQLAVSAVLDDEARTKGGETASTQMLSVNFILNTLGFMLGAALHKMVAPLPGQPPIDAKALAVRLKADLDVSVTEDAARRLLALVDLTARFEADTKALAAAAKSGPLGKDQYLVWQGKGEFLLIEFEQIPEIAKILGKDINPQDFQAMLAKLRSVVKTPFSSGVVLALPEFAGMSQVGDSVTWTFDPTRTGQEKAQDAVRARFDNPPASRVRALPGGGWEAVDTAGRVVIQVLPAGPKVAGLLTAPLSALVTTARGRVGVDLVEGQTAAAALRILLKEAARGSGAPAVRQILEALGGPGTGLGVGDASVWRGLSDYLQQGGDPARLAAVLALRQGSIPAAASGDHMRRVLSLMDGRAPEAMPATRRLLGLTGDVTLTGLAKVQEQPHVPSLEAMLEDAAGRSVNDVRDLLRILATQEISDSTAWAAVENYLKKGGSPGVLNRVLGFRGGDFTPEMQAAQRKIALRAIVGWDAGTVRGLEALERLSPNASSIGRRYANLFSLRTDDPGGMAAALKDLETLASKVDPVDPASRIGIRKVLGSVTSDDAPLQRGELPGGQSIATPADRLTNAPNVTGAVGVLRAAAALTRQFSAPDIYLRFETPEVVVDETSAKPTLRIYDLQVVRRGTQVHSWGETRTETVLMKVEVKEVSRIGSLMTESVRHQLAVSLLADYQARANWTDATPAPQRFETLLYMVRGEEIRADVLKSLGADPQFQKLGADAQRAQVDATMHDRVRRALAPALADPILSTLPAAEVQAYRTAFAGRLPFVNFY